MQTATYIIIDTNTNNTNIDTAMQNYPIQNIQTDIENEYNF